MCLGAEFYALKLHLHFLAGLMTLFMDRAKHKNVWTVFCFLKNILLLCFQQISGIQIDLNNVFFFFLKPGTNNVKNNLMASIKTRRQKLICNFRRSFDQSNISQNVNWIAVKLSIKQLSSFQILLTFELILCFYLELESNTLWLTELHFCHGLPIQPNTIGLLGPKFSE